MPSRNPLPHWAPSPRRNKPLKQIMPRYYRGFQCIAGACPDSCCKEWAVDVNPEAAVRYRSLPGPLGDRLREVLTDTPEGTQMVIENGRCPMWRPDGLCRIQAELGHEALCQVCQTFPRLRHDYGDFVELALELSCPEAARLILTSPEQALLEEDLPGGEAPEYEEDVMAALLESRRLLLQLAEDPSLTAPQMLSVMLIYGHQVQEELDGGDPAILAPEQALALARQLAAPTTPDGFLAFFRDLEILTPQWKQRLEHPAPAVWDPGIRKLARYLLLRYWLQAVSDYDILSRAKLVVVSCLLVHLLGGDLVETAQLFSKEIENDPDNIDAILEGAYSAHALTDRNILSLLI